MQADTMVIVWKGAFVQTAPDWQKRGRNGCLLVVSVTHTTPPGTRLCLVVMSHHSWLSGTLLSEDHDIISPAGSMTRGEPIQTRPWGGLMGVSRSWSSRLACVWLELNLRGEVFGGILGQLSVCQQMRTELMQESVWCTVIGAQAWIKLACVPSSLRNRWLPSASAPRKAYRAGPVD